MDSLTPSREFPYKEDSFENSPATIPIIIENVSPLETLRRLSPTSTPLPPSPTTRNEQMEAYECFRLAENSDNISEILDLLEPNELLLQTWSYFQHCRQTTQKLEKEVRFQKDLADGLMEDLRRYGIDEVLQPVIAKARREDQRLTRFARPPSSIRIATQSTITRPDNPTPNTSFSTLAEETIPPLSPVGGPNRPIVIIDDDTTPSSSKSSSASSSRKRKGSLIHRPTSRYVRQMTTGLPNLGSSV